MAGDNFAKKWTLETRSSVSSHARHFASKFQPTETIETREGSQTHFGWPGAFSISRTINTSHGIPLPGCSNLSGSRGPLSHRVRRLTLSLSLSRNASWIDNVLLLSLSPRPRLPSAPIGSMAPPRTEGDAAYIYHFTRPCRLHGYIAGTNER